MSWPLVDCFSVSIGSSSCGLRPVGFSDSRLETRPFSIFRAASLPAPILVFPSPNSTVLESRHSHRDRWFDSKISGCEGRSQAVQAAYSPARRRLQSQTSLLHTPHSSWTSQEPTYELE